MFKTNVDVLTDRMEKLEKENRRMKRTGIALLAGFVLIFIGGAMMDDKPGTIKAERFSLIDEAGHVRAVLGIFPNTGPTLAFYDKQGLNRFAFNQSADGSMGLCFFDKDGEQRIGLGIEGGLPGLSFHEGGLRISGYGLDSLGSTRLGFADNKNNLRLELGVKKDGKPWLRLNDTDDKTLFESPSR